MKAYMDHAAATPVRKEALDAMLPYFERHFANPSTVYDLGSDIRHIVEESREKVGSLIGAKGEEIIFTSSGAEANNLAIKGVAFARRTKGNHLIVSSIEHHSVLNAARFLERFDFEVTFLPVNEYGLVDPEQLKSALRPETLLVSIMHGNNEIGTIQQIRELAQICKNREILFHTDAVATAGNLRIDVNDLGVDLLTISGIPLEAPKGTGALFFRRGLRLMPLIQGGIQESGRRAGTENVPGIVALGTAAELASNELDENSKYVQSLRDRLVDGILNSIDGIKFTGHPDLRLPGHASFCVEGIEGEALIFMLAAKGIYANTGSACASKALKTSPVLVAIGVPPELAQGSVVFTLNRTNTKDEVEYVIEHFHGAVQKLRELSPVWADKTAA